MRRKVFFIYYVGIAIFFSALFITRVNADYKYDYYDFDEMVDLLKSLETESLQKNPIIFSLQTLGYTSLGNPIYAVKFSDNPEKEENDEPDVVIDGGIHSCEWLTVESCLNFTKYLFSTYYDESHPEHGEVVNLVENFEIWIIPMINPDGRTRDDANGGDPEQYWTSTEYHPTLDDLYSDARGWRCNLQEVDCPAMPGGKNIGVDPNRSFSNLFWEDSDCTSQDYNGGVPFSAVEAKVLKQFINNHMVSFVWHQHSPLAIIGPPSGRTAGLGSWISHEVIKLYSVEMPYQALAIYNPYESSSHVSNHLSDQRYDDLLAEEMSVCNGSRSTGQYQNWLWFEIDCELAPDNHSYRAIQGIIFEYPFSDENYGVPEDGKAGQYRRGDGSNGYHPSSGEVVEWLLDKSVEIYKYLIKQTRYPFSPRYYTDMTLRPEAPETDLAIVGAKISEVGEDLPGCFTYNSEGRDMLEGGKKRITWNIQNNGTDTRTIISTVKICNETEDPKCLRPVEETITREIVAPEKIETFRYDFEFQPGKDYSVELNTGENNTHRNDLKRFVFTAAASTNICPAGLLTGYNPKKMHLLRQFRDNFLSKTKTGRHYIQWYYDHSNELQSVLTNNPGIRLHASRILDMVLTTIAAVSSEKDLSRTSELSWVTALTRVKKYGKK